MTNIFRRSKNNGSNTVNFEFITNSGDHQTKYYKVVSKEYDSDNYLRCIDNEGNRHYIHKSRVLPVTNTDIIDRLRRSFSRVKEKSGCGC